MIKRIVRWIFGVQRNVLDELPIQTGSNICRKCGATDWKSATTDSTQHWLRSDVIECSKCTPGAGTSARVPGAPS